MFSALIAEFRCVNPFQQARPLTLIFDSRVARSLRFVQGAGFHGDVHPQPFCQARYYNFKPLEIKEWSEQKRVERLCYIHRNPVKRGSVERPEDWFV